MVPTLKFNRGWAYGSALMLAAIWAIREQVASASARVALGWAALGWIALAAAVNTIVVRRSRRNRSADTEGLVRR